MFLRAKSRLKDGKEHRYWSIVENRRVGGDRVVQRHVLYLGEINDTQKESWCKTIEAFDEGGNQPKQMALFPEGRVAPELSCDVVQIRLNELSIRHARQWGNCWLTLYLWDQLKLDEFWTPRLPLSRKGTNWLNVLKTLVSYGLMDPGSEWRLHRHWFDQSAMGDLLGANCSVVQDDTLYRCLDKLVAHKTELFSFLKERWKDLFQVGFDVLLYDLTSTYFECTPPENGKRKHGYSRDKRFDCVQVVIALIVTPEGIPLAYEVMDGNTQDKKTLKDFLKKIEGQYGKVNRTWIMDRGIPTEEVLKEMRESETPIHYLVGTPKGRLTKLEKEFLNLPWEKAKESVEVKLLTQEKELYVLAKSRDRIHKERSMRKRRLKRLWHRLHEIKKQKPNRDELLMKLGEARKAAGRAYYLVKIKVPAKDEVVSDETFSFYLRKDKFRSVRKKEGHYLLRSNLVNQSPSALWHLYMQLSQIEEVFRNLKGDLSIRPIFHQKDSRIEAHIFIAFLAYCLHVTLQRKLHPLAPGLTPRAILEKFSSIQMVDVHLPTTDGREIILSRYTQPEKEIQMLLAKMKLELPEQPPPKVTAPKPTR
jgi:transposase